MDLWLKLKQALGLAYKPRFHLSRQYRNPITQCYLDTGIDFGDAVSQIHMGECIGFDELLTSWEVAERAYADAGFRTISLDCFMHVGGWGGQFAESIEWPREQGEPVVLHAAFYREKFLGKIPGLGLVQKAMETGEVQFGTYHVPSTEHLNVKQPTDNTNAEPEAS